MTRLRRFLVRMAVFVGAVTIAAAALFDPLREAFLANAPLNGLIIGILFLGVVYNFRQVLTLRHEAAWLDGFRRQADRTATSPADARRARAPAAPPSQGAPPRLLAPMATMLRERQDRLSLSGPAMRSLLDGIASRLDESRDLSRYTIGLLIFLGLLGTFWGLLGTVGAVADVIGGLTIEGRDLSIVFANLKEGLQAPLAGMGTAFSSSLFGLGGSLVLGFLDLQANQAQNRFYNELEDWLSGVTRLSSGALAHDGEASVPAYVQALLEQTAESLDSLQRIIARGEEGRAATGHHLMSLAEHIGTLTDQMRTEQTLMLRLAEQQTDLKQVLARLADAAGHAPAAAMDEATKAHIRNLEVYVARLLEELASGRDEIIRQVRSDIKLLARTIAALAEQPER
ncbi:MAG: flagellar motor protein MotA [Rhodospirillales bacterium]|nr:MAG: flagellar motor protein MotA [Rhodospirillales bacterium]